MHFQDLILTLQNYWGQRGCALVQPYDMEVGAGTSHTATFLRALGPEPWRAAYVQPSRRPKDGRYGENPNRLQHYYQFQVVLKPAPLDILDLYLGSLDAIGIDPTVNDVRFVEDDWENPTLGAWGLGWEVWLNGMEVTQFTYFQQVGGLDCKPVLGEITYGLERLCMYLQGVENVFDLVWTPGITYRDVYHQNEVEQSTYNFEYSNANWLLRQFNDFEGEARRLIDAGLALPGYEMVLKSAHTFNMLDARGAISVTERAGYIGRIRALARAVALAYFQSRERLGFPMLAASRPAAQDDYPPKLPSVATPDRGGRPWVGPADADMTQSLLVELFTEELPPKALDAIGNAFATGILNGLAKRGLAAADAAHRIVATPRHLGVTIDAVLARAPDQNRRDKVLPVSVAIGPDGAPTQALAKKLAVMNAAHVALDQLERASDGKQDTLYRNFVAPGIALADGLQQALGEALAQLPIPKVMRYQTPAGADVQFARPAHALVALHGSQVVPVTALGLAAGRETRGHRFMGAGPLRIESAASYLDQLRDEGCVLGEFAVRRAAIAAALHAAADARHARLAEAASLLDEVTALVEFPVVYGGRFDAAFLQVPQECLILSMKQHQKYFPLVDAAGKLLPEFLIVSNIRTGDPGNIVHGNERVLRARLADARFFFDQDRKSTLESRVERLGSVVYHNKLGTQLQRVERLAKLAGTIAGQLGADVDRAERAGRLAKADLVTDMVGEFPELQGTMGMYYARHDGEDESVARAVEQHYRPRFANDALPDDNIAAAVALADKLDTLTGIYGVGLVPTGDKDPFGLRRAALGVLRILAEKQLPLDLLQLLEFARGSFPTETVAAGVAQDLFGFMLERLRGYLRERGFEAGIIDAVIAQQPKRIDLVLPRLEAVRAFAGMPEAESLAAANKRIRNILRKADVAAPEPDLALMQEPAEKALLAAVDELAPKVASLVQGEDYTAALKLLAGVREAVDAFFDQVMVMADEHSIRMNRLGLLGRLDRLMNAVADISRLAA